MNEVEVIPTNIGWNTDEIQTDYLNTGTFEEVYHSVFDRLWRHKNFVATKNGLTDQQSEDAFQTAMATAHKNWDKYTQGTYALGWMKKIFDNTVKNMQRKQNRDPLFFGDLAVALDASTNHRSQSAESIVIDEVSYDEIRSLFDEVKPPFRDALKYVILEEMPYKDAAEKLGVPTKTVLTQVHRGRKILRDLITERWKDRNR